MFAHFAQWVSKFSGKLPGTRFSRAASTTSLVTVCIWLISKLRSTCINSRWMTRKLPPVIHPRNHRERGEHYTQDYCASGNCSKESPSKMKMKERSAHAFPHITILPVDNWLARAHLFNRLSISAHRNEKFCDHQQKSCD